MSARVPYRVTYVVETVKAMEVDAVTASEAIDHVNELAQDSDGDYIISVIDAKTEAERTLDAWESVARGYKND